MPSKQALLDAHTNANSILNYAVSTHGVHNVLKQIKIETSGQVRVTACLEADQGQTFEGIGADKKEALADCISGQFPG